MNVYQYINRNIERIKIDVRIGLTPYTVLRQWEAYSRYDAYKKMNYSVTDAVLYASADLSISERAVYKIIKRMEASI